MGTNETLGAVIVALGTILSVGALVVKPLMANVKVMTQLNESIKALTDKFNSFEISNHDDHKRIWDHSDEQDETINKHETRISILENEVGKK